MYFVFLAAFKRQKNLFLVDKNTVCAASSILNLLEAKYNLGHCLQSSIVVKLMTANVPVKFLLEVGNNMVCGDESAKNRLLYIMLSFFRIFW